MKYIELTFNEPAENLACDEVLLDACEAGEVGEVLRFWESQRHFVVLGYGNPIATEVNRAACEARGVPILRRCTGGGTVLQGPGCLNYSLVLRADERNLQSIATTNRVVMETHRAALGAALGTEVGVCGCTDLAVNNMKFSGNAQRRRRNALLFHGSFLLNMDIGLLSELLPMPSKQPGYREQRRHDQFVANLGIETATVRDALKEAWNARDRLETIPRDAVVSQAREKYASEKWNFRF